MWVLDNSHFAFPAVEKPYSGIVANLRFNGGSMAAIATIDFLAASTGGAAGTYPAEPTAVSDGLIYKVELGNATSEIVSVIVNGKEFLRTESLRFAQSGNYWVKDKNLYLLSGRGQFNIEVGDLISLVTAVRERCASTTTEMAINISRWGSVNIVGVNAGGVNYVRTTALDPTGLSAGEFLSFFGTLYLKSAPEHIPVFGSALNINSEVSSPAVAPICKWLRFDLRNNPVTYVSIQSVFYLGVTYQPIVDYSTPKNGLLVFDRRTQSLVLLPEC